MERRNKSISCKSTFMVGDLVEHTNLVGYRGIIRKIVKYRGSHNQLPRVVSVMWFPPTSVHLKPRWSMQDKVTGTTDTSVLDLRLISSAGKVN
tara:strand:+ start:1421 stop:1699 length:279 start_codon:yes stop_codon:yes gene_type:complete